MTAPLIDYLVDQCGIESNYLDAWGKPQSIPMDTKQKLLKVMGYQIDNPEKLEQQANQAVVDNWTSVLNPVQVTREHQALQTVMRLPIELVSDAYQFCIESEAGDKQQFDVTPTDGELVNGTHIDEVEFHEYLVNLPVTLAIGYYTLSVAIEDDVLASMKLIIAPKACYKPQAIESGQKVWGLSVQLYCLRSQDNWGVGDFSDLAYLIEQSAKRGAHFIGLNPIHALYPANPNACSPYGPSSRRWLNFIYIDVSAVDGFEQPSVQTLVNHPDFQQKIDHARQVAHVDYEVVTELKLQALHAIFDYQNKQYLSKNTKLNKQFKQFIACGGQSLQTLAIYDALQQHLSSKGQPCWGWPGFPEEYQDAESPAVAKFAKVHSKQIKFFLWLQWQASLQLTRANDVALANNMHIGLYRDLAVGVSEGSAEVWGNQALYCPDASIGAPPDELGPLGQKWGLPPMDPDKLYQQAYQPFIDMCQSNMYATGALRIDHVMALLRLWWVPGDNSPKQGGYVYYPVDDLLGILALESQRNKSAVIGEDLGTVPDEIRAKLADNGIYSYRVFLFEQAQDGGYFSPSHYPEQSMATLTTHDMPTLLGFWHCHDIELGKNLGLYQTEDLVTHLYDSRHRNKQALLDTLHGHHSLPENISRDVNQVGMHKALNNGMQLHMAAGSSDLLSLQLEDWLEMDQPINVPGTFNEYPNWRRKLTHNLQDIFSDASLDALATQLTEARNQAST